MIHSPNFAKCLQETEFTFHCVWYIEPVYSTGRVAISQKANEIQFEFPTKMIGKMVVHNATILRSLPNFVVPCYTSQETCACLTWLLPSHLEGSAGTQKQGVLPALGSNSTDICVL